MTLDEAAELLNLCERRPGAADNDHAILWVYDGSTVAQGFFGMGTRFVHIYEKKAPGEPRTVLDMFENDAAAKLRRCGYEPFTEGVPA